MPTILKVIVSVPILLGYGVIAFIQVSYRKYFEKPPFDKRSKPVRRPSELNKAH